MSKAKETEKKNKEEVKVPVDSQPTKDEALAEVADQLNHFLENYEVALQPYTKQISTAQGLPYAFVPAVEVVWHQSKEDESGDK